MSNYLSNFQKDIIKECLNKMNGGLSLPMGTGKSLISLVLAEHYYKKYNRPALIIASKTLIHSWITEVKKFYQDKLKYIVLHQDYINIKTIQLKNIQVVFTTPEVVAKYYKDCLIFHMFEYIERRQNLEFGPFQYDVKCFKEPSSPFYNSQIGGSMIFSINWSGLFVDEIQKFTNIDSNRTKGMAAICATHRWGLSGTIFDEPNIKRILGYYLILNIKGFYRNIPDAKKLVYSYRFKGYQNTLVYREKNEDYIPPRINSEIIQHRLTKEEKLIYLSIRQIMQEIRNRVKTAQSVKDTANVRKYGSYLLACITYLRQMLICPMIPIASALLDTVIVHNKNSLSGMIMEHLRNLNLIKWLDNEGNIKSSRIKSMLQTLNKHKDERVVVFTTFRTSVDVCSHFITDRPVFTIASNMNIAKREALINSFKESTNGVLILTYEIGAEGLNLQFAHNVFIMDLWWNAAKTMQAIARVQRFGQISNVINIYYFSSNTGMENAILDKQSKKTDIIDELKTGPITTKIKNIKVQEICILIEQYENNKILKDIYNIK